MDYKIVLDDDELQLPAVDHVMDLALQYIKSSKGAKGGRKTRAANKKNDDLLDKILKFQVPPIKISTEETQSEPTNYNNSKNNGLKRSPDSCLSIDSDSESSRPITRSLRSRTPSLQNQQQQLQQQQQAQQKQTSGRSTPCTPMNQRLRYNAKANSGTTSSSNGSSYASSNVSATKLRQALRADSAIKKRQEEKERQRKIMLDRKAKEERAEAQKKQLLEERAIKAKLNREERINHAAELRKAREQARAMIKQQEELRRAQMHAIQQQVVVIETKEAVKEKIVPVPPDNQLTTHQPKEILPVKQLEREQTPPKHHIHHHNQQQQPEPQQKLCTPPKSEIANETFKMPVALNNIDIIIQDETDDGTEKCSHTAAWAKAPHLRKALVEQFSIPYQERIAKVSKIFQPLRPIADIDLGEIFGSGSAVNKKYLQRTSSAVWTPPNKSKKRSSSQVTPTSDR